jgi:hypothetical protein
LLGLASQEVVEGEVVFAILRGHENDPGPSALALRLMGAVHRLVLRGDAPELAAHYPSAGGEPSNPWPAFVTTIADHADELRERVDDPVQTNEPSRCAALLGGFLEVGRVAGRPLRLLEVGGSAGLNLRFDRYRYVFGARTWGPAGSPVTLRPDVVGEPPLDEVAAVASRDGCDPRPIDPTTEEGQLTLTSYVWPDQSERLARLRAACGVAAEVKVSVVQARAAEWVRDQLDSPARDVATVVFHSIVMQYLGREERSDFEAAVRDAGAVSTPAEPLAWLRMEPADLNDTEIRLTLWPGGKERVLGYAGYHGDPVRWLG